MALSLASGLASSLLNNASESKAPTNMANGDEYRKYDLQTASKSAGEELIKQVCATLNSPQNKLFVGIVENSVKSYFSESNMDTFIPIMKRMFDNAIDTLSMSIIDENKLAKVLFLQMIDKHENMLSKWIIQSINECSIEEYNITDGNVSKSIPDGILLKYATDIVEEIQNINKTLDIGSDNSGVSSMSGGSKTHKKKTIRKYHDVKNTFGKKRKTKKLIIIGGDISGDISGNVEGSVVVDDMENIEKQIAELEGDFKSGKKTQDEVIKQSIPLIKKLKELAIVKKNEFIVAKQNNSGSAGINESVVLNCDNIMDNILKGKELNEQEKNILGYMDFRFDKNVSSDVVNSKIMYVVENAIYKQLTSDLMKTKMESYFNGFLPKIIERVVYDYTDNSRPIVSISLFSNLLKNTEINKIMENAIMHAYRIAVEKNITVDTFKFNNVEDIIQYIRDTIESSVEQSIRPTIKSVVEEVVEEPVKETLNTSITPESVVEEVVEEPIKETLNTSITPESVVEEPIKETLNTSITPEKVVEEPIKETLNTSITPEKVVEEPVKETLNASITPESVVEESLMPPPTRTINEMDNNTQNELLTETINKSISGGMTHKKRRTYKKYRL